MEQESLTDSEKHRRKGAIPKRVRVSSVPSVRHVDNIDPGWDTKVFSKSFDIPYSNYRDQESLNPYAPGRDTDGHCPAGTLERPQTTGRGDVIRDGGGTLSQGCFSRLEYCSYQRASNTIQDDNPRGNVASATFAARKTFKSAERGSQREDSVGVLQGCRFHRGYGTINNCDWRDTTKCKTSATMDRVKRDDTGAEKEEDQYIWKPKLELGAEDGGALLRAARMEVPGREDEGVAKSMRSRPREYENRSRIDDNNKTHQGPRTEEPSISKCTRKWHPLLWIMLKILGLFWARPVIEERYCHQCYSKRMDKDTSVFHNNASEKPVARRSSSLHAPEVGINDLAHTNYHGNRRSRVHLTSGPIANGDIRDDYQIASEEGYRVGMDDEEHDEADKRDRCRVCDALWWDGRGRCVKYTDKSIGLEWWNHRGSRVLSVFLLITYLSLILYDAGYYASIYWGKKEDLIRYISYMAYLIFTGSVPALCLAGLLQNAATSSTSRYNQWPRGLDIRYVVRRLQYLNLSESGLPCRPFLFACTVCPFLITFYRIVFYAFLVSYTTDLTHSYLACVTCAIGLTVYGAFSYFIYLMRVSFYPHLKLDVDFIRNHVGELDICRAKIFSTVQDFQTLRQLANGWMVMVFGVITWAVATQITWNYLLFSGFYSDRNGQFSWHSWTIQMYINGLVTMENLMFFFLPCFAIGGFNINIVWIRFHYRLLELRRARHELFWYRLQQFIREQHPLESSMRVTMLFTLIGLFVALQFGEQNIYYFYSNVTAYDIQPAHPLRHGGVTGDLYGVGNLSTA